MKVREKIKFLDIVALKIEKRIFYCLIESDRHIKKLKLICKNNEIFK